jgi:hypothetical protein
MRGGYLKNMNSLILNRSVETAFSLRRYFKFVLELDEVDIGSLADPYGHRDRMQKVEAADLLVIDGFMGEEAKGFQFAKAMEKRAFVLFYNWELGIETEGYFWLVLPEGLERLGDKIKEIMANPAPGREEYEALEERFPELRERKGHHHLVNGEDESGYW